MRNQLGILLLSGMLCTSVFAHPEKRASESLSPQQSQQQFINQMVTKHHFNREKLTRLFDSLHENHAIIASMTSPYEKQSWVNYRNFFMTPERITLGVAYLEKHRALLLKMQKEYGIPASVIVAIIGVETEYGMHLGKYRVLDSLYTLGFYYPPREKFFRKELGQYLILTRDANLPVAELKGSYAGALGIPQFMPSSYRYYGVSAEKNGRVDLFKNNDAIASVANYFHKMGWKPYQPIAHHLASKHESINKKLARRIALPLDKKPDYWAVYRNFNVIMSYNHNVVYAMVVYQLSKAIDKQYAEQNKRA